MRNVNKEKILKKVEIENVTASFAKGWFLAYERLPEPKMMELASRIMLATGIVNESSFIRRLIGKTIPNIVEAKAITEVFAEIGIPEDMVFFKNQEDYENELAQSQEA